MRKSLSIPYGYILTEKLFTFDDTLGYGFSHSFTDFRFITVKHCAVNQTITSLDGVVHDFFCFKVRKSCSTKANERNLVTGRLQSEEFLSSHCLKS